MANEQTTFTEAFSLADDVLYQGVKGVTDLMVRPGIINLDFADIRSVMDEMGKAMMGTGEASGEDRAIQAAEKAIANPLLDEISLQGARGVLINVTGGDNLTLFELDEAANRIREEVDPEANIIVGSTLDSSLAEVMRVSVVATGIDAIAGAADIPVPRRSLKEPLATTPEINASKDCVSPANIESVPASMSAPAVVAEAVSEPSLFEEMTRELPTEPVQTVAQASAASNADPFMSVDQSQHVVDETLETSESFFDRKVEVEKEIEHKRVLQPSEDATARLEAAVLSAPLVQGTHAEKPISASVTPEPERPKGFRLNSLISRMTGQGEVHESELREQSPTNLHAAPAEDHVDPEMERIEIPAFLRRQAN
ncbi:MAG: cell division protein FtsZ [Rhodobacteraceae bacterium]|nr:cell division protein FtsZ [Paracoccaceae bacterium]